MNRRESGYSLVEILVVVAMIGIISLVTVPNFIAMQHSNKMKASLRGFVSNIRSARQRAVTRHVKTKVSFVTGTATTARTYSVAEFDPATSTWTPVGTGGKGLEESCYFFTQTGFTDIDADGTLDVVFKNDGALDLGSATLPAFLEMKSDWKNTPKYKVTVEFSGAVKTEEIP
jgi:prepilin-type N-terminal cleavage/methylation domain-containing protein